MKPETLEKLKMIVELLNQVIEDQERGKDEEAETQDTVNPDPKPPKP